MATLVAQSSRTGPPSRRPSSRILELDGIRAIAILLVLGCHYPGFARLAGRLPELGWSGVDIFFTLSGYLITTILLGMRQREGAYKTFYSRRFIRILPPYLVVTIVLIAVAIYQHWSRWEFKWLIVSQVLFLQALPPYSWAFLAHLKSAHFGALLGGSLPMGDVGAVLSCAVAAETYWSLSIEEYFYLLWAPVVLRLSRRGIVIVAVLICVAAAALRWLAAKKFAYFLLVCRFDALLFGALLAMLLEHWRKHGKPRWADRALITMGAISACGLAVILALIAPILGREIRSSVLFLVFGLPLLSVGVAAVVGLAVLHAGGRRTKILRYPILTFIGTISYTMYLIHLIIGAAIDPVMARWPMVEAIVASVLTIIVSYASWHWLEKPLLRWKDRRFPNSPHPAEPKLV
ncbi:MAG TPA: acyltransferase [Bryocella sp.]|nr:acyltransferase [Bryocella sp.]